VAGTEGAFEYAMTASALLRRTTALVGERFGSELRYAIGAGVRAAGGRLLVGPELQGAVSLVHDTSTGHPLELDLGAHYAASARLRFGLGLTRGLVNAVGTPDWRGLLSVAWNP
jgi:hypothetical protein